MRYDEWLLRWVGIQSIVDGTVAGKFLFGLLVLVSASGDLAGNMVHGL